ncbi:cupin domain-containing protein [Pseudonocardia sp. HH130629-09]|uniref:cupin domain-containing protein n=1 Tax=Pseudonocardia sp. HH130629-09 TaxID=1641402 RepID=UPI0006CB08CE|nr:cupin domain-containing protein [Pseudonocardia sp. HH130629-09]ALE86627.1 hypothetical protein XF36_28930 [Pseudonocardia sp. HH130629-09]
MIELNGTTIQTLDEHPMTELPAGGHLMTVVVSVEPNNPGTPAHRHPGPVYGYVLEGEMIVELEGDAPVLKRAGDTIWEPGGDRIHYQAANPGNTELRFVVLMACKDGEDMLTFASDEKLEARKHLRHPGPVVDPRAAA